MTSSAESIDVKIADLGNACWIVSGRGGAGLEEVGHIVAMMYKYTLMW